METRQKHRLQMAEMEAELTKINQKNDLKSESFRVLQNELENQLQSAKNQGIIIDCLKENYKIQK